MVLCEEVQHIRVWQAASTRRLRSTHLLSSTAPGSVATVSSLLTTDPLFPNSGHKTSLKKLKAKLHTTENKHERRKTEN